MEVKIEKEITTTLKLTKEEARWLKLLVQNSFHTPESEKEKGIRHKFWEALPSLQELE